MPSIDEALSRARRAPFSVVGLLLSVGGVLYMFHATIQKDAFEYGYGSLATGATLIAYGTLLQHTKKLEIK